MSACDTCPKPGHCCTRIHLSGSRDLRLAPGQPAIMLLVAMATRALPFVPLFEEEAVDCGMGLTALPYRCPLLGADGRCTEYDNRPQLCRDYEPGRDRLCVLHPEAMTA